MAAELCKACFKTSETEVVQIMEGGRYAPERKWVDTSIRRCANSECHNTTGGTLAERLAYIDDAYGYKYFGDYELSPAQNDAVWEAKAIASLVPDLVAAASCALGLLTGNMDGDMDLGDPVEMLRAAIAKTTPRASITPTPDTTTAEVAEPVSPPIRAEHQQNQSVGGGY